MALKAIRTCRVCKKDLPSAKFEKGKKTCRKCNLAIYNAKGTGVGLENQIKLDQMWKPTCTHTH